MNGCIYEFKCNTRICMLHSIWCIYVFFAYMENFKAYYYPTSQLANIILPHFAVELYFTPESVKNNKFHITTKHNTRTNFSNYFYHTN